MNDKIFLRQSSLTLKRTRSFWQRDAEREKKKLEQSGDDDDARCNQENDDKMKVAVVLMLLVMQAYHFISVRREIEIIELIAYFSLYYLDRTRLMF